MHINYPGFKDRKSVFSYRFIENSESHHPADEHGFCPVNRIFDGKACPHRSQVGIERYRNTLFHIAELCNRYGVSLIVVTTPCSNSFIETTMDEELWNMYETIDSIRSFYRIEYRDYMNDSEFRSDSLYCDPSHLNYSGAKLFTQRFKQDFGL